MYSSINDTVLESNKRLKLNFDGGELSSDAGLLLLKEFINKIMISKFGRAKWRVQIRKGI